MSTPRSLMSMVSNGFFLAFIISGNFAYRGSFNLNERVTVLSQ